MSVSFEKRSRPSDRWWLASTLAVCVLHLWWLSSYSFWFDELFTAGWSSEPSLADAFERWFLVDLNNPPLYGILTLWIGQFFGVNELTLRLPSWLFVTASCVLLLTAAPVQDVRVRRLAGLLLAVTPFAFVYSQEARSYGLLLLESTIVLFAYMRFVRDHRLSPTFLIGVVLASLTHYFGLLFAGMLLLLAFGALVRRGDFLEAAKAIPFGVMCWSWLIYVVTIGRMGELTEPFWIAWSWTELVRILMSLSSATLAAVAVGAWLWHRQLSGDLWWRVLVPALAVSLAAVTVSLYKPLIVGRYFIVLAPAVALVTADVLLRAWERASGLLSARVRYAIVGVVAVALVAENVVWMQRQKWGPYQNYRAVAEFVLQDTAAAGDRPVVVSIVLPSLASPVRILEQHYFKKAGSRARHLRLQLIEPAELTQRAVDSDYLIVMHWPDNVTQARRYVASAGGFVEIDIPTSHKSMTFLAKRGGSATSPGASHGLSSAGTVRPMM